MCYFLWRHYTCWGLFRRDKRVRQFKKQHVTGEQVQHRGGGRWAAKGDTFRMAAKEGQLDAPPRQAGAETLSTPVHPGIQQVHRGRERNKGLQTQREEISLYLQNLQEKLVE